MYARLKHILSTTAGTLALFSAALILPTSSCEGDKCKTIVCANGGTCSNGTCGCVTGYEGFQCETTTRDKFTGIWSVTEDGTISNSAYYTISLENSSRGVDRVNIKNFRNNLTAPVDAYVRRDTLYIPQQEVNGKTVQGIGFLGDDPYYGIHGVLNLRYQIEDELGNTDDFGFSTGNPSLWNK